MKNIPQVGQIREIKQNMIKNNSLPKKKQKKNISQNKKEFKENIETEGFGILKWIMNCYF